MLEINLVAVLFARHIVEVKGGHLEHLTGALTVTTGDDRGVDIDKTTRLEELVNGATDLVAHTRYGTKSIGARSQVAYGTQELKRCAFLLKRILFRIGKAEHFHRVSLHFCSLAFTGGLYHFAQDL